MDYQIGSFEKLYHRLPSLHVSELDVMGRIGRFPGLTPTFNEPANGRVHPSTGSVGRGGWRTFVWEYPHDGKGATTLG